MNSELVVDVNSSEISIALLEDKRLVELNQETRLEQFSVGNVYLGKVKKIMPGLNAVFVDVGYGKDAFLHYLDLGFNFNTLNVFTQQVLTEKKKIPAIQKIKQQPEVDKHGSIDDLIKVGQDILVQVTKEPISTKGPRLTSEVSIAGRFLVLIPFSDKVSISQKIKSDSEKQRLKQLIQSIKPKGYGVIIRTVAEDKKVAELDNELKILVKRWEEAVVKVQQAKGVSLILEEIGRTIGIIRDIFNPDFKQIHINNEKVYTEVRDYIELIAPDKKDIVKLYKEEIPIYDAFGITKQIKSSFGKIISFKSGGYLIIEHTEALHVIDVNSGNRSKAGNKQEENALEVNLAAADEIARQLRLRDLGGIIVVDFIDMHDSQNRQALYDRMKENMSTDRAKHNILQISKFGLLQMTRQRVRPAANVEIEESCPTCYGTGKASPSILFTDQIESKIDYLVNELGVKNFVLQVHPYVDAFIRKGVFSLKWRWSRKFRSKFQIVATQQLGFLQFKFFDANGIEINVQEQIEKLS